MAEYDKTQLTPTGYREQVERNSSRTGRPLKADPEVLRGHLLELVERAGYERTTMGSLAAEVGMSVRTLHRYFPAKADIVWGGIEVSVEALAAELHAADDRRPALDAVADAVASVFARNVEDLAIMRTRLRLIALTPELRTNRSATFEGWRHAIIGFVASRLGETTESLVAVTAGTAIHTTIMEALSWWALRSELVDPSACITEALRGLTTLNDSPRLSDQ